MLSNSSKELLQKSFSDGLDQATVQLAEILESDNSFHITSSGIDILAPQQVKDMFSTKVTDSYLIEIREDEHIFGQACLLFAKGEAHNLLSSILKEDIPEDEIHDEQHDVLGEVTNIVVNSCIEHIAKALKRALIGNIPLYQTTPLPSPSLKDEDDIVLFHSRFQNDNKHLTGNISFLLSSRILDDVA